MSKVKQVKTILKAKPLRWVGDGLPVYNALNHIGPNGYGIYLNPFILLDYVAPYPFEPSDTPRGIGEHPHRGFETVTMAYEGEISHQDTHGHSGTIHPGDVQWMTAGSGVQHAEKHSDKFSKEGGVLEMIQLWINLPKKDKMTTPKYQALTKDEIPEVELPHHAGKASLIAGAYNGVKGPASTFTPMNVWNVILNFNGKLDIPVPAHWVSCIFVRSGVIEVDQQNAGFKKLVVLETNDEESTISISSEGGAKFVVLTGEPITEPLAARGPMVMNTMEEVKEAFKDYKAGRFGKSP